MKMVIHITGNTFVKKIVSPSTAIAKVTGLGCCLELELSEPSTHRIDANHKITF